MTTYTSIPDSDVDPESPGTTTMFTRLRDNPIAITEGATNAPRIVGAAAKYRDDYDVITGVTATTAYNVATIVQDSESGTTTTSTVAPPYTLGWTITNVLLSGTVRYSIEHYASSGGSSELRVLKNGSAVNSWSTTSTTAVTRTEDIAVVPGDVITWEHWVTTGAYTSYLQNGDAYASDTYTTRPLYVKASESTVS